MGPSNPPAQIQPSKCFSSLTRPYSRPLIQGFGQPCIVWFHPSMSASTTFTVGRAWELSICGSGVGQFGQIQGSDFSGLGIEV